MTIAMGVPGTAGRLTMRDALIRFKENAVRNTMARLDSWVNHVTGFGTDRDKSTYGYVLPPRLLMDDELSSLYHGDDMAARMVDVVPQEMLREGFTIDTGEPEIDATVSDKMAALDTVGKFADGIRWGRCYGGSAILIGADDGRDANQPLRAERAKDIDYLYVIDRRFLWPLDFYEAPGDPKLGHPKSYMVSMVGGTSFQSMTVHESRLILFRGAPTGIRERAILHGWDYSVLQRAFDTLRQFNTGWKAVETLLTDGNQAIFKMTGLAETIGKPDGEALLRARLQAMDLFRSVMRALVVDADSKEAFERQSASFADIPSTLDKFMLRLAAAVQIPVTILMGQSPAGMNATGDSDFRWFYDRVRSEQTTVLAPKLRRLIDVWMQTKAGREAVKKPPKSLAVKFPKLWTETPLVEAQRRAAIAQGDAAYLTAQVLIPEEVALSRFRTDGFATEIQLTKEATEAREAALGKDLDAYQSGEDGDEGDAEIAPADVVATAKLQLTASDIATIVTVNEARASVGQPPFHGADGKLTLPAFKAKYAALIASATNAEEGTTGAPVERQDAAPRTFVLYRKEDETGVSGTGEVGEGCVFGDGRVAMRWKTATSSTTLFDSIDHVLKVHGHAGRTEIRFTDGEIVR